MPGSAGGPLSRFLGDRLRFARRVAGLSQVGLAGAIGVPVARVRRYESGQLVISAATLLRLATVLDVPLSWLYGVDDRDHWPEPEIPALLRDPDLPRLVAAFRRIADPNGRRLVLELVERMAAAPRGAAEPVAAAAAPAARVLLVDDAPDVLVVVGAFLRSGGYEVVRANGAGEALRILQEDDGIGLLVTDYAMPGMNGLQLAERAAALRPGLPALVITAYAADLALAAGRLPGVAVLAKPFARVEMLAAVARLCAGASAPR